MCWSGPVSITALPRLWLSEAKSLQPSHLPQRFSATNKNWMTVPEVLMCFLILIMLIQLPHSLAGVQMSQDTIDAMPNHESLRRRSVYVGFWDTNQGVRVGSIITNALQLWFPEILTQVLWSMLLARVSGTPLNIVWAHHTTLALVLHVPLTIIDLIFRIANWYNFLLVYGASTVLLYLYGERGVPKDEPNK